MEIRGPFVRERRGKIKRTPELGELLRSMFDLGLTDREVAKHFQVNVRQIFELREHYKIEARKAATKEWLRKELLRIRDDLKSIASNRGITKSDLLKLAESIRLAPERRAKFTRGR